MRARWDFIVENGIVMVHFYHQFGLLSMDGGYMEGILVLEYVHPLLLVVIFVLVMRFLMYLIVATQVLHIAAGLIILIRVMSF
jgi:hypothetical protein